mmetsp:Transcript_65302/g.147351  ORF Transcript_65302/g.147351 Transcript_65302/m.147351 type:complete len:357 (-) Transcript_65302:85-1155(-)|eukprot:CAMPEP_0197899578 /NCGR_PEP_ID=MMETSP1439-20131203/46862_1 /TAXON_ID=66791 /ORGANISM="Gonyaulax spinifera, Strain CCMP409" /LENGTH=356 /DNA_ID=CAMNT_0043520391 /DNA_START=48 /DNA_END=1118 /DNA_ORIENTATION=-
MAVAASVLVLAGLVAGSGAQPTTGLEDSCASTEDAELFRCWLAAYKDSISRSGSSVTSSLEQRFSVFQQNLALIREHNAQPLRSWDMAANEFAAHTWEEFKQEKLSTSQDCSATHGPAPRQRLSSTPPASVDWRTKGVVTPVKNQGGCGSCWTFSTSGVVESHLALAGKNLTSLSEQQLIDCAGAFNNHGCNGGLPSQAMEYIRFSGGLESEADYPYRGKDGKCNFDASKAAAHVADVVNITQGDEDGILQAVGSVGPVSIAYDCTMGFQFYRSGVWDGWFCGTKPSQVNHAVLAVGYGNDPKSGLDYWLVKNSWGTSFGEAGYFRIIRGKNKCGLADCASYPKMAGIASGHMLVV